MLPVHMPARGPVVGFSAVVTADMPLIGGAPPGTEALSCGKFVGGRAKVRARFQNSSPWGQQSRGSTNGRPRRRFISFALAGECPAQWLLK